MAKYSLNSTHLTVRFNWLERRVLGRPNLIVETSRLMTFESLPLPGKSELGLRVSKKSPVFGVLGEYRSRFSKVLVLAKGRNSGNCLKIQVSHPNIDVIWVCGSQANDLRVKLAQMTKTDQKTA